MSWPGEPRTGATVPEELPGAGAEVGERVVGVTGAGGGSAAGAGGSAAGAGGSAAGAGGSDRMGWGGTCWAGWGVCIT